MAATVFAAAVMDASPMSPEYANAVCSPVMARTPTPDSMEKLPLLTMLSSSDQLSLL